MDGIAVVVAAAVVVAVVAAGVVVAAVVAGVVRGVVAGLLFALIILKSSSGSGGMFNNFLHDPSSHMYLPYPSILVGAQVHRSF